MEMATLIVHLPFLGGMVIGRPAHSQAISAASLFS